jgi:hypothetical protein
MSRSPHARWFTKDHYRNDPKLRDQDPGPFRAVGVPYKAPR